MKIHILNYIGRLSIVLTAVSIAGFAASAPKHGIAMYGEPQLPPDFVSLPYVNPDAPNGGTIATGEVGTFDSLNPYILKGNPPWQLRFLGVESLMGRSWDEPFSLYGLLAESIEVGENREWVEFVIRPEARFSDGSNVTVEDVIWSYETLGTVGHPRYHGLWKKIKSAEKTGERSVKFTFNEANRELALIAGMRPILKKAQWDGIDFADSSLDIVPITTSPYIVEKYTPGRVVVMKRNEDYWGEYLPFRRGTMNLNEVRMEFFGDGTTQFEAFKAGVLNSNREFNAQKWDQQYAFPAIDAGNVVKSVLPHERPSGITGFVMNTRRDAFKDWRVRDALLHTFNFEFINNAMTDGKQPRITSYYSNSILGMKQGPAEGLVKEFLTPFASELIPGALEGYALPVSDGSEANRKNIRKALQQFQTAGYSVNDRGVLVDVHGAPFTFDILLKSGSSENIAMIELYTKALERVGITPTVTTVDGAQYKDRTTNYDFDMTYYRRGLSLSPGNEQYAYWGAAGITEPGSRNWMGMNSPAAEAMIDKMLNSANRDEFLAAVRALDRVLTAGRYVIPIYQFNISRIAHAKELKYPDNLPIYGDWIGWQPDVWWFEPD